MRYAILVPVMLAACQQASAPAGNAAANANSNVTANTAQPPLAGAPDATQAPARIPAKFRGVWAEGRAACAQLSHQSRLIISERVIRYPSHVLVSESIDQPTDAGLAVKGYSQRTGAPAEAQFSIDPTGNTLTDEAGGGAVRVRCG